LETHGFERVESGNLVATYARSTFEDTRRKAIKFGAHGTTVMAHKPERVESLRKNSTEEEQKWPMETAK
jgi:hypothetical protein